MRAKIVKKIIKRLSQKPSILYRNLQLQVLLWLTAKAFGVRPKWLLFSKAPLETYMLFSKQAMAKAADLDRVFETSYAFGKHLRALTGLKKPEDRKELVYFLYRYIGIKMVGELPEEFYVKRCRFSECYGPEDCWKMSAMDAGIIAGIYEGLVPKSRLVFTKRLTEGCSFCRAELQ